MLKEYLVDYYNGDLANRIIKETKTIAVVGLSPKTYRTSHQVSRYLQNAGYKIIPVNPGTDTILGEKCRGSLTEVGENADLVLIFRRSEFMPKVVEEAVRIKPKFIWMQEGIFHKEAAQKALNLGIDVIMDRCMLKEHRRRK
ncbi:MAG: CoA-binding protein [Calditrichia bacterium]|nr:CoA-binding protein [Calditrichia bacterium]